MTLNIRTPTEASSKFMLPELSGPLRKRTYPILFNNSSESFFHLYKYAAHKISPILLRMNQIAFNIIFEFSFYRSSSRFYIFLRKLSRFPIISVLIISLGELLMPLSNFSIDESEGICSFCIIARAALLPEFPSRK